MEKYYLVIAHLADGDVNIGVNGNYFFTKEEANEVVKDHASLGVEVEAVKTIPMTEYKDYKGEYIPFYKVVNDVINVATKTNADDILMEVIISWGLNPSDIKEEHMQLLQNIIKQKVG